MEINIDTTELGRLSQALIQFRRSAFPSVTRLTLNDLAFETKKNVNKLAGRQFTIREKANQNIFNKGIVVEKAKFDRIESMKSRVGINNTQQGRWGGLAGKVSKQETGGIVNKRSMIALNTVRTSKSNSKKIMSRKKPSKINLSSGNSGGHFILKSKNGKKYVTEKQGRKGKLKLLYSYKKSRKANIQKRPFLAPSGIKASKKTIEFFRINARKTIGRQYGINI